MKQLKIICLALLAIGMLALVGCSQDKGNVAPPVEKVNLVQTVLYVPSDAGNGVVAKTIEMPSDKHTPKAVLEALLSTENKNPYSVFPKDIQVKAVTVKAGLAYVELNDAFLKPVSGGSLVERLELASIVNTLTEFKDIQSVMFIVNGNPVTELSGHVDMTEPLQRMPDLVVTK